MKDPRATLEYLFRHASHSYPGTRFDVIVGWPDAPKARFSTLRNGGFVEELVPIRLEWIDGLKDGRTESGAVAEDVFEELDKRFRPAAKAKQQRWDVRIAHRVEGGWLEVGGDVLWPCGTNPMSVIADVAKSRGVDLANCHRVSAVQVGEPE